VRLVGYGELQAQSCLDRVTGKIPLTSLLASEERRDQARGLTDEWSRDLDAKGAPLE
jgi:hypothetical protein